MRHRPYVREHEHDEDDSDKFSKFARRTKSRLILEMIILMQPISVFGLSVAPLAAAFFIAAGCFAIFIIVS